MLYLFSSSDHEKGTKGDHKGNECNDTYLYKSFDSIGLFLFGQDVLFEDACKEGESSIEVNVFEVEKNAVGGCCFGILFPADELYAHEEDGLHDDVVLEMYV